MEDVLYVPQEGIKFYSRHELFNTWRMMNVRCYDGRHKSYHRYGERGITVCDSWVWSNPLGFRNFVKDVGPKEDPSLTLDRRDNNKGYEPDNCSWVTRREQQNNISLNSRNTSGAMGVSKRGNYWVTTIMISGSTQSVGVFNCKEDAEARYDDVKSVKMSQGDDKALLYIEQFKNDITGKLPYSRKTSKYYGVRIAKDGVRYSAATHYRDSKGNLRQKFLGVFEEEEEAAKAVEVFVLNGRVVDD